MSDHVHTHGPGGCGHSIDLPVMPLPPEPPPENDFPCCTGVEITDEAVRSARKRIQDAGWPISWPVTRLALEDARPFMTSRPALDREAVIRAIEAVSEPAGSYVTPTRMYVENWADVFADAVMALAVPVPTEDDIVGELSVEIGYVAAQTAARAVLALLNGSTK